MSTIMGTIEVYKTRIGLRQSNTGFSSWEYHAKFNRNLDFSGDSYSTIDNLAKYILNDTKGKSIHTLTFKNNSESHVSISEEHSTQAEHLSSDELGQLTLSYLKYLKKSKE